MIPPSPDPIEKQHPEPCDDAIPTRGYQMVPLVGMGGSAGAIPALQHFFKTVPSDSGLAFVVILHLSPDHESTLHTVLQRCTSLRVVQVVERVKIEPNSLYVIPPRKWLRAVDGFLESDDMTAGSGRHVAVDLFFRSLADNHGPHSAAIVLSGADADGSIGIKRIKERGGLTIAQDPQEAEQTDMPLSAMATGMVDWVLPVGDMVHRLVTYFRLENELKLPPVDPPATRSHEAEDAQERALSNVLNFLRTRTGRDFTCYKRATILRRIGRRMQVNGNDDLVAYLASLRMRPGEAGALLQDLLISVTNFFRDAECFSALEAEVPALFAAKRPDEPVRAWVAACATGEEAYSVAMLLTEHAQSLDTPPEIQVFATDLDEQAIQMARDGLYPTTIEADVSAERLRRFFIKEAHGYRVSSDLRKKLLFAQHDVLKDSPFSRVDLISCRNFLIYLKQAAQERVFDIFHYALLPGGRLFLGSSESIDEGSELFSALDKTHRLYAQRPGHRSLKSMPSGPGTLALALNSRLMVPGQLSAGVALTPTMPFPARMPKGMEGRHHSWGELHLRLLEELAPPSVLVDSEYDIVHLSQRAGQYLQYSGGEPSRNLLRMVHPSLRIELRAALYQAAQNLSAAVVPPISVELDGATALVGIRVQPASELGEGMFLVVFERASPSDGQPQDEPKATPAEPIARHLDRELERLKAHLRETVEQYEASTEELKASNEELQAMNEELRSATEELETGREELQSINEELSTVNHELKIKVEELGQANSDMHNLMDATAIATVFLDRDLRITRFTPSAVEIFNFIPADIGRPLTDLTSHLHYGQLGEDARLVLERLVPIEREVGQSDGTWFLARLRPYRTIDDRIAGVVLTFVNITERKRAEEVRLWLSAVVTASSDAIISFSLDKTILSWNGGAERIFGFTAVEAIGKPLNLLMVDEDGNSDLQIEALRRGKTIENHDALRRHKDGHHIHVAITVSPIRDDAGKVMAGTTMVRDISSSREAAEALRSSEQLMRMVIENATEYAIFSTDLQRRITIWNSGAERILGYTEREVLGQTADIIFVPEDRSAGIPAKETGIALAEGRSADDRFHQRKDGSRFWASGSMMLMRDANGEAAGFVKILRDQTAARQAEEALHKSQEELLAALSITDRARRDLEAADTAKDRFLAVLSHELRNPLASIASAADLLNLATSNAKDRTIAGEVIARQSHAMRTLLDDLLDISRLRLGRLDIQRRPVGLGGITLGAIETTRPLADAAEHQLSVQLPSHEIEVLGDPIRLGQVVMNLLTNAIKYTPPKGLISVSLELVGEEVVVVVTDNGIGLAPGDIDHVFDMFTQMTDASKRHQEGLGIGLALVSDIVRLHNGRVEASSPGPGKGSSFRVFLPVLRTTRAAPSLAVPPTVARPDSTPDTPPDNESLRVLVVDDNRDMAWSLAKHLELTGYAIRMATCGEDALTMAEEWQPAVLILDIGLPDIEGREVGRRLRARPGGAGLILIAVTGWGQERDVRQSLEAGFDAHLTKPIQIQQLLEIMDEQIARRGK
ncbi:PAS domain S-box protein [Hydrogenophaga sp. A37]|uniref:PAS domain S-box protein n=1 Tax=Hydrogenophaga sp. A37 TaxID=1945864 RepID=UPI0009850C1B|nr:PAS domain S-box protein [Hydrogenophaga sp. A37]OOG79573.1 histidine kinase [Hydrogenophaga sp. A37]